MIRKKGIYNVVSVLLLVTAVVMVVALLVSWGVNFVNTNLKKIEKTEFCYVELYTYSYDKSSKKLSIYVSTFPNSCRLKIYIVKDGETYCKGTAIVNEPFTKITISNCDLSSGEYMVNFYTWNNVPLESYSITIR